MEKSEKLKQLLDYIGINEDNMAYFINSYVEKVSVDSENNIFIFYIRVSDIPKKNVYDDVLSSLLLISSFVSLLLVVVSSFSIVVLLFS